MLRQSLWCEELNHIRFGNWSFSLGVLQRINCPGTGFSQTPAIIWLGFVETGFLSRDDFSPGLRLAKTENLDVTKI